MLNSLYKIEEIQPFITNFVIISMSKGTVIFTILFFGCLVNSNETFACKMSNGKLASAPSNHGSAENNKKKVAVKNKIIQNKSTIVVKNAKITSASVLIIVCKLF